jgi:membrane protein DedA with SNARE-associated domain
MRSWIVLSVLLLALILGPFVLFEASMNAWVDSLLSPQASSGAIAAAIASVLALDVFLPVPSSIVSTAAGALLGFGAGIAVSTAGMTAGCMLGYLCGQKFGLPLVRYMVRERDLEEVTARFRRGADWALATMRPVPVLAEASALVAGVAGVPFPRFLGITALANAGISTVYCAAGAEALDAGSFLIAFAASIALPGCLIGLRRLLRS